MTVQNVAVGTAPTFSLNQANGVLLSFVNERFVGKKNGMKC